ncbi:MAG: RNA methyltransferase [Actinobacteria bacterium]|nr:RNA methyltransferase [Actinomycetota bacterium]MBW3651078.1 RNA methyltransferase [Actinomycetota bacterium]
MAKVTAVEDPADGRVADFVLLTDPDLRRRREQSGGADGGFFIAEGELVIRQLLASPYRVRSLLLTPARLASLEAELAELDVPVFVAGQEVVNAISGFHLHRGALAAAERGPAYDPAAVAEAADLLVVAEGVNDHENLGALFRNSAAFGAGGLLLDPTCADPLYRRSVRVSMGHVLRVPFARLPGWPQSLADLRSLGFEVLALTPAADAVDIRTIEPRPRQALVVGAEGPGLSAAALATADRRVRVAMAPGVDSLNVATAAAVALHHLRPGV